MMHGQKNIKLPIIVHGVSCQKAHIQPSYYLPRHNLRIFYPRALRVQWWGVTLRYKLTCKAETNHLTSDLLIFLFIYIMITKLADHFRYFCLESACHSSEIRSPLEQPRKQEIVYYICINVLEYLISLNLVKGRIITCNLALLEE